MMMMTMTTVPPHSGPYTRSRPRALTLTPAASVESLAGLSASSSLAGSPGSLPAELCEFPENLPPCRAMYVTAVATAGAGGALRNCPPRALLRGGGAIREANPGPLVCKRVGLYACVVRLKGVPVRTIS